MCSDPDCPGNREKEQKGPYRDAEHSIPYLQDQIRHLNDRIAEMENDYADCENCNRLSWFQAFLFIALFVALYYFAGPLSELCYMWIGEHSYIGVP